MSCTIMSLFFHSSYVSIFKEAKQHTAVLSSLTGSVISEHIFECLTDSPFSFKEGGKASLTALSNIM